MVSVSQISNNINSVGSKSMKQNNQVSFKGADPQVVIRYTNLAKKQMSIVPWLLNLANKTKGEIANAWITAAGTAIIAPLVIAFHPFSKADKETKQYSAWRQPISAVLQLVTQLYVNTKYNRYLEQYASTGNLKFYNNGFKIDMRSNPSDSYVERMVALKHPGLSSEEFQLKVTEAKVDAFKKVVNEKREEFRKAKAAGQPLPIDFDKHPEMLVGRSDLEAEIAAIEDPMKKELERLKAEKNPANAERIKELQSKLSDTKATANQAMENAKANIAKDIEDSVLKKQRVRDIASKFETEVKSVEAYDKAINEAKEQLAKATGNAKESKIWNAVVEKLECIKKYELSNNKVKRPFDSLPTIGKSAEDLLTNLRIKQFVKAQGDVAKHMLTQTRLWSGIGIGLAILPVSCILLNEIYPRLMEYIMPEVAQKRKLRAQQLLVQNSKKMEVKA